MNKKLKIQKKIDIGRHFFTATEKNNCGHGRCKNYGAPTRGTQWARRKIARSLEALLGAEKASRHLYAISTSIRHRSTSIRHWSTSVDIAFFSSVSDNTQFLTTPIQIVFSSHLETMPTTSDRHRLPAAHWGEVDKLDSHANSTDFDICRHPFDIWSRSQSGPIVDLSSFPPCLSSCASVKCRVAP